MCICVMYGVGSSGPLGRDGVGKSGPLKRGVICMSGDFLVSGLMYVSCLFRGMLCMSF